MTASQDVGSDRSHARQSVGIVQTPHVLANVATSRASQQDVVVVITEQYVASKIN